MIDTKAQSVRTSGLTQKADSDVWVFKADQRIADKFEQSYIPSIVTGKTDIELDESLASTTFFPSEQAPRTTTRTHSRAYLTFNMVVFIDSLIDQFHQWRMNADEDDAIMHISNIRKIIDEYYDILSEDNTNRLLVTTLELLFVNNNWERVQAGQIQILEDGLSSFKNGDLTNKQLDKFMKLLYRSNLSPIG